MHGIYIYNGGFIWGLKQNTYMGHMVLDWYAMKLSWEYCVKGHYHATGTLLEL